MARRASGRPTARERAGIIESIELIEGEAVDRRLGELRDEDWDVEAILPR